VGLFQRHIRRIGKPNRWTRPPTGVPTSLSVDSVARRFDGGVGTIFISNGYLLPPGKLTAAELQKVRVYVDGVEQQINVKALSGTHADGSLRAVRIQFYYPATAEGVAGSFVIDDAVPRQTADIAEEATNPWPQAVFMPTDQDWLIASRVFGVLRKDSENYMLPFEASLLARLDAMMEYEWNAFPIATSVFNVNGRTRTYEMSYNYYRRWAGRGDLEVWYRSTGRIKEFLLDYYTPNFTAGGAVQPWLMQPRGLEIAYFTTGHEEYRYALRYMGQVAGWYAGANSMVDDYRAFTKSGGDVRPFANFISTWISAKNVDAENLLPDQVIIPNIGSRMHLYFVNGNWRNPATGVIPKLLGVLDESSTFVAADGYTVVPPDGVLYTYDARASNFYSQRNYMAGLLMRALIRYYEEVDADARIPDMLRRMMTRIKDHDYGQLGVSGNTNPQSPYGFRNFSVTEDKLPPELIVDPPGHGKILMENNGTIGVNYAWYAAAFPADPRADEFMDTYINTIAAEDSPVFESWSRVRGWQIDTGWFGVDWAASCRSGNYTF
jgi:hypothetical protein